MRIGTLTFQNTINFGAMLQTYALFKTIDSMGFDCEVINYTCPEIVKNEHPISLKEVSSIRRLLYFLFTNRNKKRQFQLFQDFYQQYIRSSEKTYNKDNIGLLNGKYRRLIVGSDQVWNLDLTGRDFTYFLDFENDNRKKSSYAASFGYEHVKEFVAEQKELLSQFKDINVRESSAVSIVQNLTGRIPNVVLDPTLLLTASDWDQIINSSVGPEKYCLVYLINRDSNNMKIIKEYAKTNHLKIVYIQNYLKPVFGVTNIRSASPSEFVSYIKHADMVFTGSFHALCFSIIYHKQFYFTRAKHNRNSRIDDLIELLGICGRGLSEANLQVNRDIDYTIVDDTLDSNRIRSLEILKDMCKS